MTKKNWLVVAGLTGMLILIAVMAYSYIVPTESTEKKADISVVVYNESAGRWTAFKQGVDQAATDLGAVVNFLTVDGIEEYQEQINLLEREVENGAQGLVIAPADSQRMEGYITRISEVTTVVLVESGVENSPVITCVSADANEMGAELAKQIVETEAKNKSVTLLQTDIKRTDQRERQDGFMDVMMEEGWTINRVKNPGEAAIKKLLKEEGQILAALDDLMLETAAEAAEEEESKAWLYGIGSGERIAYSLDRGLIKGIVFQNDFNLGYEAVDMLIRKIRGGNAEAEFKIDYHYATKDTMHLPENERLLYPIIQ